MRRLFVRAFDRLRNRINSLWERCVAAALSLAGHTPASVRCWAIDDDLARTAADIIAKRVMAVLSWPTAEGRRGPLPDVAWIGAVARTAAYCAIFEYLLNDRLATECESCQERRALAIWDHLRAGLAPFCVDPPTPGGSRERA